MPSRRQVRHLNRFPLLLATVLICTSSLAQDEDASSSAAVTLYSDEAEYLEDQKLELNGNVEIQRGEYRANSQHAIIDQAADSAELDGGIEIIGPELEFSGDSARMDLRSEQSEITNASFFNPETRLRGKAKALVRENRDILKIQEGSFTTCEPEQPDWEFEAEEIELDRASGFGVARNTRFRIRNTPVMYIPWFKFPIDDRRQSGFLYPSIGSANTGRGAFVSTPYYWNIAPQADATITPTYINRRGLHTEVEGRHLSSMTRSTLVLGYIENDDYFVEENNGHSDGERWGLNLEQTLSLESWIDGWNGDVDYSAISDNDYLDDLNQGLQIGNRDHLDRRLTMRIAQDNWRASLLMQHYKSLDETLQANEQAYQRLPEINFHQFLRSTQKRDDWYDYFDFDWRTQYVYFYRDPDELTGLDRAHGSRLTHDVSLRLPMSQTWGYAETGISLNHSDYLLKDYPPEDNHLDRTVPTIELDTGLYFDRNSIWFNERYRHSIEPRAYYVYTPEQDQNGIPNFDTSLPSFDYSRLFTAKRFSGGDRIGDNNRLSLGFTSRWVDTRTGRERARLSFAQLTHFENRKVKLEDLQFDTLGSDSDSDRFLASEFMLQATRHIQLSTSGLWDRSRTRTQETVSRISYRSEQYSTVINLSHRYLADQHEQSETSAIIPLNNTLSMLGRWQYDLDANRTIGTLAGLEYQSCCWRAQLLTQQYLTDESEIENSILFRFQLVGIGGVGASNRKMDQLIPGYADREAILN